MLGRLGFSPDITERVVYLVEHHHTYSDVDGPDYQILLEADFLVNMHEEEMPPRQASAKVRSHRILTRRSLFSRVSYQIPF
ncbi:MAG: hypothetical protein LBS35_07545 [Synergistaceae bacterium]|jgi:hypothetical protein|nr:hypothetical protein [Synergistaceae bacterium]